MSAEMARQERTRLLYVDVNASFINPTRNLLPNLLRQAADVRFFGPGYVERAVLDRGLRRFVDDNGPFDFIATNTHILHADPSGDIPDGYRTSYGLSFPYDDLGMIARVCAELPQVDVPKIALLFENDFYNFSEEHIARLDRNASIFVGLGQELFGLRSELPDLTAEPWSHRANDNWANYVRRHPERTVSLPLYVGESEFSFRRLAHRAIDWLVPGSQYRARVAAIEELKRAGIEVDTRNPAYVLQLIRQKLRILRRERLFLLRMVNLLFWLQLERTRCVYTCGSGLAIPVRKFFEIPAAGAVLVCSPCRGFEALGFRNGENAVIALPKDLPEVHRELKAAPERAQSIADAGQRLVMEQHSTAARARDLRRALAAIKVGTFAGGGWYDGCFTLFQKQTRSVAVQ